MGKTSKGDASVPEDASLVWSEEPVLVKPCLEEPPFEDFCGDVAMGNAAPSIGAYRPYLF